MTAPVQLSLFPDARPLSGAERLHRYTVHKRAPARTPSGTNDDLSDLDYDPEEDEHQARSRVHPDARRARRCECPARGSYPDGRGGTTCLLCGRERPA